MFRFGLCFGSSSDFSDFSSHYRGKDKEPRMASTQAKNPCTFDLSSLLYLVPRREDLTQSTQDDTLIQFVGGGVGGCVASICTIPAIFFIIICISVISYIKKISHNQYLIICI
jgi:hypothetical protein